MRIEDALDGTQLMEDIMQDWQKKAIVEIWCNKYGWSARVTMPNEAKAAYNSPHFLADMVNEFIVDNAESRQGHCESSEASE